jgi:hypothetical protein
MHPLCQTDLSWEHRTIRVAAAGVLLFGILVAFLVPPSHLSFLKCAFHSVTGHSCLMCGMTRSLYAIAHGEFAASVRHHLFGPAVFIAMLLGFMVFSAEAVSGKKATLPKAGKIRNRILIVFAVLWLVYWAARLAAEFAT